MATKFYSLSKGFFVLALALFFFNGQAQWHRGIPVHPRVFNAVQALAYNNAIAAGGNLQNDSLRDIVQSPDTGQNFNPVFGGLAPWIRGLHFPTKHTGYAVGFSGGIFKTTDGGSNWTALARVPGNAGTRNFNGVFFTDSLTGYVVGGVEANDSIQTILKTTDGGANWSVQSDNLGYWLKSVFFTDANTGYAVGAHGTYLVTTNGGSTWAPVSIPGNAGNRTYNAVYFISSTVGFIVGGNLANDAIGTILKTTNGGTSWGVIADNLGPMLNGISFADSQKGYIVGNGGTVLTSNDGGDTWATETITGGVNDADDFYAVSFLDRHFGVAVGDNGKILTYFNASTGSGIATPSAAAEVLSVYPNPAKNEIFVACHQGLKNANLQLFDLTGRMVINQQGINAANNEVSILNVGALAAGTYLLKVSDNNGNTTLRICIQ